MPPKRGKSANRKSASAGWDTALVKPRVDDDEWSSFVLITVAGGEVASSFLQRAVSEAETGTRKRFHAISYDVMIAWARELAKSKSKSKDPVDIATSEACGQAVALLDGDKPITAELIARLIKTKIMAARAAELEARAAAAAAKANPGSAKPGSARKKSAKGKKGKGPAADGPGKKDSKMVTRDNETVKTIDDEPEDGPAAYFFLQGFGDANLPRALAAVNLGIGCIVRTTAETEGQMPEDDAEIPAEPAAPPIDLEAYERTVRAHVEASISGDALRKFLWLSLPVGTRGCIDPDEVFGHVARLAYDTLKQRVNYAQYLKSLDSQAIPAISETVDTATYTGLIDAVPADRQSVAVVLDCMLQHVTSAVAGDGIAAGAPAPDGLEAMLGSVLSGLAIGEPSDCDVVVDAEPGHGVYRTGDAAGVQSFSLRGAAASAVEAAERNMVTASRGALLTTLDDGAIDPQAAVELHRLQQASSFNVESTNAARRQLLLERMLGTGTAGPVDLTGRRVEEDFSDGTLPQVLNAALGDYEDIATYEDKLLGTRLVAMQNVTTGTGVRSSEWSCRLNTFVDFNNYVENVAPVFTSNDQGAAPPLGYDVGDLLIDLAGQQCHQYPWNSGHVLVDRFAFNKGAVMTCRVVKRDGTRLTLHLPPNGAHGTFVGSLLDGLTVRVNLASEPEPEPESVYEPDLGSRPNTAASSRPPTGKGKSGKAAAEAEAAAAAAAAVAAAESAAAAARIPEVPMPSPVTVTCATEAGLLVSFLESGWLRQARRGDRATIPRCSTHLNLGDLATEVSRSYMANGCVARYLEGGAVQVLHPDGSTSFRAACADDWTVTDSTGQGGGAAIAATESKCTVTGSTVTARADGVLLVANADGSRTAEFADGTRIMSSGAIVRVECLGFAAVEHTIGPQSGIVTSRVELGGATVDFGAGLLVFRQRDGTQLRFNGRESGAFSVPPSTHPGQADSIWFSLVDLSCTAVDRSGGASLSFDAEGQPIATPVASDRWAACRVAPRLFQINADGTGTELHLAADVAEAVDSTGGNFKVVRETVAPPGPGRSDDGTDTPSEIVTCIRRTEQENAFLSAYSSVHIKPEQLRRKTDPYEVGQCLQAGTCDEVRQLVFRPALNGVQKAAVAATMAKASDASGTALPADVEDGRTVKERTAAAALLDELGAALETCKQWIAKGDAAFIDEYTEVMKPPAPPPRAVIDMTKDGFDSYFPDGLLSKDIFRELAGSDVPKYFDSPEHADIMLYHKKQAAVDDIMLYYKKQATVDVAAAAADAATADASAAEAAVEDGSPVSAPPPTATESAAQSEPTGAAEPVGTPETNVDAPATEATDAASKMNPVAGAVDAGPNPVADTVNPYAVLPPIGVSPVE